MYTVVHCFKSVLCPGEAEGQGWSPEAPDHVCPALTAPSSRGSPGGQGGERRHRDRTGEWTLAWPVSDQRHKYYNLFRLVELSSLAVTAEEDVTPRPVPAPSIKLGAKSTRRGSLANALWGTVPIPREEKSTIARRSTFTGN